MGMFFDICGLFKAVFTDLGNLLDPYPKKKGPSIHKPDDKPTPWGADSYEPWDFLSEEQWEEIFRGEKPLEDFTMSHAWPPEKQEDNNIVEVEQENAQEQGEDSENAESSEGSDASNESEQGESDVIDSASDDASDSCFESDGSFESGFDSDSDGSSSGSDGYND